MKRLAKFILLPILAISGTVLLAQNTLPPAKQAIEQQYDQERAAGQLNPAPRNPNAPFPIVPPSPFETGIFTDCDSLSGATVVNCWRGIVGGTDTSVYAGSEPQSVNPQQGIVVVLTATGSYIPTPVQAGPVQIVAAQNDILTLVTTNNAYVLTFDVNAQAFTAVNPVASVPSSSNGCDGVFAGTFIGDITVSSGQTCIFVAGGINGNVTETGGNLVLLGATAHDVHISGGSYLIGPSTQIMGNLEIANVTGAAQGQICGASISKNLLFHNNDAGVQIGASHSCVGSTIGGNLDVHNNGGPTAIFFNSVAGDATDHNNTGPTQVYLNDVGGNLDCHSNSVITGGMNTAQQKQGQCSGF